MRAAGATSGPGTGDRAVPGKAPPLERTIEAAVVRAAAQLGILSTKMNLIGRRGWPDRCFWLPGGRPLFIEFKRQGQVPTSLQAHTHEQLRAAGYRVEVVDDAAQGVELLEDAHQRALLRRHLDGSA